MKEKEENVRHICPWYHAYLFDNPLRRLLHDPAKILGPYVKPGMTVADIGCGMGFFSIGMARLVGQKGKVLSRDVQPQMLRTLESRARRKGLADRIGTRLIPTDGLGLEDPVDFALCFWMVHETPDQAVFFKDLSTSLKPGGAALVAEPNMHVNEKQFGQSVFLAKEAGFEEETRPKIRSCRSVVIRK